MLTIKFGTTLLYSIPSMVLYFMTFLMVRKYSKDFSSTFLKLYKMFFVFNNVTFFNSFITVRIPQNTCKDCLMSFLFKWHTVENPSWFPLNFFYFIHFSMAYVQFFLIFLTSLNRFTMIIWSSTYEKTFNRLAINDNNKSTIWSQIAVTLLPYTSDGLTLIHPWLFLAFSTKARRCFLLMYFPKHVKVSSTTAPNSTHLTRRSQGPGYDTIKF
ncbi:hypothetical protein L3Y34_006050 [Caenorhabditis briggsae]|uniref:Serpentine receptor class gamma n=1 Tax=Caenorhabditis briggsae TaxID=6238 RepID=A0AAE8ZVY7_CAEBR|nr:hypothetical protein L3Y34_006050 [Caenorhabditis briggsae]